MIAAMGLSWANFRDVLDGEPLPTALIDLDALDRNTDRIKAQLSGSGKTLRVASKSVRHTGLLRRILDRGGEAFRGLMCFTGLEAAYLASVGFDDLLVAYPSLRGLDAVAKEVRAGKTIRLMADHVAHLRAYGAAAQRADVVLEVLLDLDPSHELLGGKVHLGPERSPLRTPEQVEALARRASSIEGVRVVGLMGYEALIAGMPDATPFSRALNPMRRVLKHISVPKVAELRGGAVAALRSAGVEPLVVNGGGTGSLETTTREPWITEVTAGSGFVCSHLFDYYRANVLEPAAYFALEVSRLPGAGLATCLGGGYVASGEPGWDKLPLPWLPEGMSYLSAEGAGEVQTPLRVPTDAPLSIGDPVIFRHAKAGELAERFDSYLLVRGGAAVGREPTYRGAGQNFL